jgi:hypothetical protein
MDPQLHPRIQPSRLRLLAVVEQQLFVYLVVGYLLPLYLCTHVPMYIGKIQLKLCPSRAELSRAAW